MKRDPEKWSQFLQHVGRKTGFAPGPCKSVSRVPALIHSIKDIATSWRVLNSFSSELDLEFDWPLFYSKLLLFMAK